MRRLPGFAAYLHLGPAEVWALETDEFVVLAQAVDDIDEKASEVARAGR